MECPVCKIRPAIVDPEFGVCPCSDCQEAQSRLAKPANVPEFTGDSIKENRKKFWADIHGAHRKGQPSAEFRDTYGKEAMKRQGFTDKEIKNAKPVWSDDRYYGNKNG